MSLGAKGLTISAGQYEIARIYFQVYFYKQLQTFKETSG